MQRTTFPEGPENARVVGFRRRQQFAGILLSAVARHRFLFCVTWLWERRSSVLPPSPEIEMECLLFSHAD